MWHGAPRPRIPMLGRIAIAGPSHAKCISLLLTASNKAHPLLFAFVGQKSRVYPGTLPLGMSSFIDGIMALGLPWHPP